MDKTRKTILIADDDQDTREGLRDLLQGIFSDCTFVLGANGNETLALLQEKWEQIAVALVDNTMPPGKGGIDLTKTIREMGLDTPIIIIAGVDDPHFRTKAKEAGATEFFLKPPQTNKLVDLVKVLIEK